MNAADQERALERAAAPTLAAIAEDKARGPKWLRSLFAAGARLLFLPELSLDKILEATPYRDPEVWTAFGQEVEQSPWDYFRDARLETSARLLLETDISISEVGYLVGYSSPSSFRRLLRKFLGAPPSRYRRQARRVLERAGDPPAGAQTHAYWERLLAGKLSDTEARELDAYLERLAPASATAAGAPIGDDPEESASPQGDLPDAAPSDSDERSKRLLRTLAEGLIEALEIAESGEQGVNLSFAEQRRLVREAVVFPDATLFELLSERGVEAGRDDPERGVELATLAVDSLTPNRMLDEHPGLAALAWARLARARWRADDPEAAEQDLERSTEAALDADEEEQPATWEAERTRVLVAFRWHRGRRLDGFGLASHMVAEHRAAGGSRGPANLAVALLLRAELRAAVAELEPSFGGVRRQALCDALADVEEAHGLLDSATIPPRPPASLWARLLVAVGNRGERLAGLRQLTQAAADLDEVTPLLRWLEGHCSSDPEPLWRDARDAFAEGGDDLWVARVTLDLIRLFLDRGRPGEAAALASELASILGGVAATPEDLAALQPLSQAAPFGELTDDDLNAAESVLKPLEWQRRTRRAPDFAS